MPEPQAIRHIYFMPGLAANPSIFDNISLPKEEFEVHFLEWLIPERKETMASYAKRMCSAITHKNCALIGVSFGGVLVQEMAKYAEVARVIIISSVKTKHELPRRIKLARKLGFYKLIPTSLVNYVHHVEKLPVGSFIKKRARLYQTYLSINNKRYLDWAIKQMVCWERDEVLKNVIHINGDNDAVFPIEHIDNVIPIKGGTHIMIINKYRWFNKHLPSLITKGKLLDE